MSVWWKVQIACFLSILLHSASRSLAYSIPRNEDVQFPDQLTDDSRRINAIEKRFMGIFRCNGWGPGCSHLNGGGAGVVINRHQLKENTRLTEGVPLPRTAPQGSQEGMSRGQPYFTLTSGESWGPTGKRSAQASLPSNFRTMQSLLQQLEYLKFLMWNLQTEHYEDETS